MNKDIYMNLFDENLENEPNAAKNGVYTIRAINPDGTTRTLSRVAGKDSDGILYIGEASDRTLFERVCDFRKTILRKYKSENHSG
ncbi:unnamed protein product, partial [marine sediment metagenome]